MIETPLITVVTISYNNTDSIYKTIESVCAQSYDNIEYIISDDASDVFPSDEIEQFFNRNKKENILFYDIIHHEKNVGTVRNLNFAYKKARGEIIIPLSCGDCFFSVDSVAEIVERFKKTKCKILATTMIKYEGDFSPINIIPHLDARSIIEKNDSSRKQYEAFITAHFHEMIAGCNMYIKKETIEEYGYFDEKYDLWEDGPFLSRYLYSDKIEYAYDIVSIWYENGGVSDRPFDRATPRMRKDAEKYATSDAIKHIDSFSFADRRRIRYRYKRIEIGRSIKRYILYALYLPELLHYLYYTRKSKKLSRGDAAFISNILTNDRRPLNIGK